MLADLDHASIIGVLSVHLLHKPNYQSSLKFGESSSSWYADTKGPVQS